MSVSLLLSSHSRRPALTNERNSNRNSRDRKKAVQPKLPHFPSHIRHPRARRYDRNFCLYRWDHRRHRFLLKGGAEDVLSQNHALLHTEINRPDNLRSKLRRYCSGNSHFGSECVIKVIKWVRRVGQSILKKKKMGTIKLLL